MAENYILKLGTAGFLIDDMPDQLPLAGEQAIAIRKFPGGRIHIQNFGAFENEINIQSAFFGTGAFQRALAINNLRVIGDPVLLRFGTIARYVIITKYTMTYQNNSLVGYDLTLQPSETSSHPSSVSSKPTVKKASVPASKSSTSTAKPKPKRTYTIKKGDTLWALAVRYYGNGNDWHKIASANHGIVPTKLKIGSTIVIPY